MFGILLMLSGTFFEELSTTAGKINVRKHLETPFSFGFISTGMQAVLFALIIIVRHNSVVFSWESVPMLATRVVLEIVHATITLYAITRADRSTFGFIRTLTIPSVLAIDLVLGYSFGWANLTGIFLIILALLFLFMNHGLSKRGSILSLSSALLAAVTTSLFKYSVTHYNSPEIDQAVVNGVMLVYFYFMAQFIFKEDAVKTFFNKRGLAQSSIAALGGLAGSYAYLFAPAAVLMAARRAMSVFWSVLSGRTVFHERRLAVKLIALFACAIGLSLLAF
ncbi:MAG: hypothetical protein WC551_02920 [Patescibacteria group bacterium]